MPPIKLALALLVLAAACGGAADEADGGATGTASSPTPRTTAEPEADVAGPALTTPAPVVTTPLPSVQVVDVTNGDARIDLATLLPSDRPVLLWFWAPH